MMVTSKDMNLFAAECVRWSGEAANASDREIILYVAKMWADTASRINHRLSSGDELVLPDLRSKLN
jgi:hypothetical protein